jgi:hypothetical protein
MNIPQYIKDQIDQEIYSLKKYTYDESKQKDFYPAQSSLNELKNSLENLEKNKENKRIREFQFKKISNNKIIKNHDLENLLSFDELESFFENGKIQGKIEIVNKIYEKELEQFNLKFSKSQEEINETTKKLKKNFDKIKNLLTIQNYNSNKDNSKLIKEIIIGDESNNNEIFEILCYYIQPSQLFDRDKNENCTHLEIRNYIIDQLNKEFQINLEHTEFVNNNEFLKNIIIEDQQINNDINQEIIHIISILSNAGLDGYDRKFIQEIFFNWSKIFPNTNFADIQNLIQSLVDNNVLNAKQKKEFLDFLISSEFTFFCKNINSSIGVCKIVYNQVNENDIDNHDCKKECIINKDINDFYRNILTKDINSFFINYKLQKNILIQQIIIAKIYDSDSQLLKIALLCNKKIKYKIENYFVEKITKNPNSSNIFGAFLCDLLSYYIDYKLKTFIKANKKIFAKNTNILSKLEIDLFPLLKNNLKEFNKILNNKNLEEQKINLQAFLKEKILKKDLFENKVSNKKKQFKESLILNLKKNLISILFISLSLLKFIGIYFISLIFKLIFESTCIFSNRINKFLNQSKQLIAIFRISQILIFISIFIFFKEIATNLYKVFYYNCKQLGKYLEIGNKRIKDLEKNLLSNSKQNLKINISLTITAIFISYFFGKIIIYEFLSLIHLIFLNNAKTNPQLEILFQIQSFSEIKNFLKSEIFNNTIKTFFIIIAICFTIEFFILKTVIFCIDLYNSLNINFTKNKYDENIEKLSEYIIEIKDIKNINFDLFL